MRQRFGALLCLALGAVLIWSGLSSAGTGNVGQVSPPCGVGLVGALQPCPTGVIHFTETTTVHHTTVAPDDPTPPATGWQVHITSTCFDTSNGSVPVDETVTVPNNGTADSDPLNVYTDQSSRTKCDYDLSETNSGDFTATFTPASPVELPDATTQSDNDLAEALANDATVRATTTPAPPSTPASSAPVASSSASVSATASQSGEPSSVGPSYLPSSSGGGLANTGPSRSVNGSLIAGIALCVLGFVLLFAGRVRRPRKHSG